MEVLIRARESRDLGESRNGQGDVDWLRASGYVAQRHPLALALWRLIEQGDRSELAHCYHGMVHECVNMGNPSNPVHTVCAVLDWMVSPRCPACKGRGRLVIPGSPVLSDLHCDECHGRGDRQLRGRHERALYSRVLRLRRDAARAIVGAL